MAVSKYSYVRNFELSDSLLPGTFIVFRLDGHCFHRFSEEHGFAKPNDERALQLMDRAACEVMGSQEYKSHILLAFGESDEFSFLLRKSTNLYNRRQSKLVSTLTSLFTSSYVFHWASYFPKTPLKYPPCFDGRVILYPTERQMRDYFAWRQADTHINNLYNTAFWALVQQGGESTAQAHATLKGTVSSQKNELLFSRFGINYNMIDARFRKGSTIVRGTTAEVEIREHKAIKSEPPKLVTPPIPSPESQFPDSQGTDDKSPRKPTNLAVLHCDIIKDEFWESRPTLLVS